MKKLLGSLAMLAVVCMLGFSAVGCGDKKTPTLTPTVTATPTAGGGATPTVTVTVTPTATGK